MAHMRSRITITLEEVASLRSMLGDADADPDLVHDMIEGETDAFELMSWALDKISEEETMQEAIANRVLTLRERSKASDGRVTRLRGVIEALMTTAGEMTVRLAEATVTISQKKQGIASIDESQLPDSFFVVSRTVNKSAINTALKDGAIVPGVLLDNGGQTLMIRRK